MSDTELSRLDDVVSRVVSLLSELLSDVEDSEDNPPVKELFVVVVSDVGALVVPSVPPSPRDSESSEPSVAEVTTFDVAGAELFVSAAVVEVIKVEGAAEVVDSVIVTVLSVILVTSVIGIDE
ncbi:hypothetical protein RUND412_001147 [Rhizina undulata]